MRVIICGSRGWGDAPPIRDRMASLPPDTVIVTGGARGADALGHYYGHVLGFEREVFPADWEAHGKAAGPIRNLAMLDAGADLVIAFRSGGESRGTDNMIAAAKRRGVPVEVFPA